VQTRVFFFEEHVGVCFYYLLIVLDVRGAEAEEIREK
jgi:hypothetical protein